MIIDDLTIHNRHLAKSYSHEHPTMQSPQPPCDISVFQDGITNGAAW